MKKQNKQNIKACILLGKQSTGTKFSFFEVYLVCDYKVTGLVWSTLQAGFKRSIEMF